MIRISGGSIAIPFPTPCWLAPFAVFLPILFQSVPAVLLCVWLRCNVPLTVAVVWISNPITIPPMMYFAYRVGQWLLGTDTSTRPDDFALNTFFGQLGNLWQPLLLGCFVCGLLLGTSGFVIVRLYFRLRASLYLRRKRGARL